MTTEFKCDLCEYLSGYKSNLNRHKKIVHHKIKDFECELCDYFCSSNGNLKIHMKQIHDKIKDIKCELCYYTCSQNNTLKAHMKQVHDKIKDFKCDICDFTSSRNVALTRHTKSVHDKIKKYECKICDAKFSENSTLKKHIKSVHERSPESKRMSLGEFKLYTILKKFKVEFKQEFTFQDLRSEKNSLLRFDFGIKNKNNYLLIEFDGRQHFEKVRWNSYELEKQINDKYEYIQQCDKQKNDYVSSNNHQLLRIRYDDIDIENKILDFMIKHYDTNIWQNNQRTI